jgi:two-component system sensor histidine kinase RegB
MDPSSSARALPLEGLVRLRSVAIATYLSLAALVAGVGGVEVAWAAVASVLGFALATNLALAAWSARRGRLGEGALVAVLVVDVATLTFLLHLTGGPANPFAFLYLVQVVLAVVTLPPRHAWFVTGAAIAAYAALFVVDGGEHAHHHHGHAAMRLHLQGMGVAMAVTAVVVTSFVGRMGRALAEARAAEARAERLAGLGALAAGAAHELATPLSTISVVAAELEQRLMRPELDPSLAEDARLALREVERCHAILRAMCADAGEAMGERWSRPTLGELVEDALEGLPARERVVVEGEAWSTRVEVPRRALAQSLRALIKNALEAAEEAPVRVTSTVDASAVHVHIADRGTGMRPEVLSHVGEPFFTTKPTGRGMGLGVFLARTTLERLGGGLELSSRPGEGTTQRVRLPAEARSALARTGRVGGLDAIVGLAPEVP